MRGLVASALAAALLTVAAPVPAGADGARVDPVPTPDGPRGTSTAKSLVIGIDGATFEALEEADTPNLDRLMAEGTTSVGYRYAPAPVGLTQQAATVSGPGWTTLLTGVWPHEHGVRDNTFDGARRDRWPDYLTRAEARRPALSTFSVTDWDPLGTRHDGGPVIGRDVDVRIGLRAEGDGRGYVVEDERSTDVAARHLRRNGPDLSFVYLGKTDVAGHASGSDSPQYRASLEADDVQIGTLLDAIRSRRTFADEDWQVIVTNDHGHTPGGGHGGSSLREREEIVIAAGGDVDAGVVRNDLSVVDVAPTALEHVGLAVPRGLAGRPIDRVRPDAFDAVRDELAPALDEDGLPADLLGWAHQAPGGWRVDDRRMPDGGVAEWRGWTFTTDPFWTSAAPGQGRENFVGARGVLAVADSDEWDDLPHDDGAFDSTLVTPAHDVAGDRRAVLRFSTHYQQDGDQRGTVRVSFDGGRARTLATYDRDVSGPQGLPVRVPAGATEMTVRFRYRGTNDWYWALDDVRVVTPDR